MTADSDPNVSEDSNLIVRSQVPAVSAYGDYKEYLRDDFFYSCGYCTISEVEAQGRAFEIDHYEPVTARPDLETDYLNLIYACDQCNMLKGDLVPPPAAKASGLVFFRPDHHDWNDHFEASGYRIKHKSSIGMFTVEVIELNRQSLRRLREIRQRLQNCNEQVAAGVLALRRFKIDQLPPSIRGNAHRAITQVASGVEQIEETIEGILKSAARSPLLDSDPDQEGQRAGRASMLSSVKGLFPGMWRGREYKKEATVKK